jgi:hypothetical protein
MSILLFALFTCISIARNTRQSTLDWSYDGDLTLVLDFANDFIENDSKFIIFGSYAAHLASNGLLPYQDIDLIQTRPSENPVDDQSLNLHNRTVVNYNGRVIDLKVGFVASMDDLIDAVNINSESVAFEFEKFGVDDIRFVNDLKDDAFDEFLQTRTLKILEPQRATADDCIRVLSKAERYGFRYELDSVSRENCEKPRILHSETAKMARPEITGAEFANRVFSIEGSYVWARSRDEAEEYLKSENQMEDRKGGRRVLCRMRRNLNSRRSLSCYFEPYHLQEESDHDHDYVQQYYKEGAGKCVTDSGADPSHMYFHGIGQDQCKLKCQSEPACYGFSVSTHGNCLHWMQSDIKAGGAPWGGAWCWIAKEVVHGHVHGRRNLQSAQNSKLLLSQDRREPGTYPSSGYQNVGHGKCVSNSGGDPAFNYLHGVGEETCRSRCSGDSQCFGFSVSIYGNCLLWTTDDLKIGSGPAWGGAQCWIAQSLVDSRSSTIQRGRRKN